MKKLLLISLFFVFAFTSVTLSVDNIIVQSGSTSTAYEDFQAAIDAASDGDIIYLPPGSFNVAEVEINKGVHIIGAGYNSRYAKAGITILTGDLHIMTADGGSLSGVKITSNLRFGKDVNTGTDGYTVSRCHVLGGFYLGFGGNATNNGTKNITITECIFNGDWNYGAYSENVYISNCFFYGRIFNHNNNVIYNNCIFVFRDALWALLNTVSNTQFKNCIILQKDRLGVFDDQGNAWYNNIFTTDLALGSLKNNDNDKNSFDLEHSEIFNGTFTDEDYRWQEGNDYTLTDAAKAAVTGTDGKEVGIYGGDYPFKEGGVPVNPQVLEKEISTSTNPKGHLQVKIKVKAQNK